MKVAQAVRDGLMASLVALGLLIACGLLDVARSGRVPEAWSVAAMFRDWPIYLIMVVFYLVVNSLIGIAYAAGFEKIVKDSGPAWGMLFSLPHIVFTGYLVGYLPFLGFWPANADPGPGLLFMNMFFTGPFVLVFAHWAYGITMGMLYDPIAEPRIG
ncbi:MAG TPA: hypothetical protein VIC33_04665 [Vicinamibacterales bacterium]|jgi:hypothetical protein